MQKKIPALRSRTINSRLAVTVCGAMLLILSSAMDAQVAGKIMTWGGNTPDWDRALHLGAVRLGCSDAPSSCAGYAQQFSKSQGVSTVFLAILLDANRTPDYMEQYSGLSVTYPALYEVGFDDFVGQSERQNLSMARLSTLLNQGVRNLKSANPNLQFGITVYEDELNSSRFPLDKLDEQFRNSVDFVHLYPHYRKEAEAFSVGAERAKQIFPHAKIIAGIYAYDRRDYLPCARGTSRPCTKQEEVSLFAQSFRERLAMLQHSEVSWIEFYPGDFGKEAHMGIWNGSRGCNRDRIQECVDNTREMRDIVRQALNP